MGLMRKLLKWTLWILIAVLLAYFTLVIVDWPLWVGILFFVVYLVMVISLDHYIRKKIYQHRTGFITAAPTNKSAQADLYTTLQQTLQSLSRGGKIGIKKHFLMDPWALYFEFENSNLTAAINSAEILPVDLVEPRTPDSAHWYWINNLVIIRPNQNVTQSNAHDEHWLKFLQMAKNKRKQTPFNKIMISLSIKLLIDADRSAIQKYLEVIKNRCAQIREVTGYQIPAVVILSDLNALSAYNEFIHLLSPNDKQQAFGCYNRNKTDNFGIAVLEQIASQIDNFMDRICYERKNINPIFGYLFAEQLRGLQAGWNNVNQCLFDPNQSEPLFSGLFFLGVEPTSNLKTENQLVFSHDLLSLVLRKQNLKPLITLEEQYRSLRESQIRLAIIYTIVFMLIIYVIAAFTNTSRSLTSLLKAIPSNTEYTSNISQNLMIMTEYNHLMHQMIDLRHSWTIKILPFNAGLGRLEKRYAQQYVTQFQSKIMIALDQYLQNFLRQDKLTPLARAYAVQNIVTRINIIQAKLNHQSYQSILQLSSPELNHLGFPQIISLENFGDLYKTYVLWENNADLLRHQQGQLQQWLEHSKLLNAHDAENLHWLVDWANTQPELLPQTLSDFWRADKKLDTEFNVPPAYTHAGAEKINELLGEISLAVSNRINLSYQKQLFTDWYQEQRLFAWYQFALNFNHGIQTLSYKTQWDYFYNPNVILSIHGPYYQLLDLLHHEFANVSLKNPPQWLVQIKQFYSLLDYQVHKNKLDTARNITVVTRDFVRQIASKPSTLTRSSGLSNTYRQNFNNDLKAAQAFLDYQTMLHNLYSQAATSQGQLFGVARAIYDSNVGKQEPQAVNLIKAFDYYNSMRNELSKSFDQDSIFWLLLRGPFDYYIDYINRYSSCYVQQQWDAEVVTPTNGLAGDTLTNTLFGPKGLLWSFINKYAESFLTIDNNVFIPQLSFGHIFPFSDSFYEFINSGLTIQAFNRDQSQFEKYFAQNGGRLLTINSNATNVNAGAKLLPYQTVLRSVCNKQIVEINNNNFPTSESINWALGDCGPAQITLHFNGITLTKDYPGKYGFAKVLHDFARGPQTFSATDFPQAQTALNAYNVKQITVNYQIIGLNDALYTLDKFFQIYDQLLVNEQRYTQRAIIPANITLCWNNSVMQKIYTEEANDINKVLKLTGKA